ncbi:MAG: flagellar export protein FliJ [Hyphomicrobiaceae bacterium TMED74]|nr:flagellar export protein FliJ [Filomicrobium sp.]RPG38469.1 MAG: flagellar export protein FliJ [Hyphomicrobiaceae bacterium TMED74]
MKVREYVLRFKRFDAEEKMQKVSALEQMVHEFEQVATDLERQIQAEEERTGVRDMSHFAYSTFARSAAQRRENLLVSIADLHDRLNAAVQERDEAVAELGQADAVQQRDDERTRVRTDIIQTADAR